MKTKAFLSLFLFLGLPSVFSFGDGIAGTLQDIKARGNGRRRGCILKNQIGSYGFILGYLPYDEAYLNVGDDHVVIFLPNLLIADNALKLLSVYNHMRDDHAIAEARNQGQHYLAESLKSVKTEWADQIQKGFEDALPKK